LKAGEDAEGTGHTQSKTNAADRKKNV